MKDISSPISSPLPKDSAVNRLIETAPFSYDSNTDRMFCAAMREAAAIHHKNCAAFRGIWDNAGFMPGDIKTAKNLYDMPFIFVSAFKERDLVSVPKSKTALELTSSGTSGQRSRIVLDKTSLLRVRRIAWQVFAGLGMAEKDAVADYLCFTYDPETAKNLGTAFTDKLLTGFTQPGEIFYAIKWNSKTSSFYFDMAGAAEALLRFEKRGRQTRILGFPAHAMMLCEEFFRLHGRNARLHPSSWVITGGGWKDKQDRAVDKSEMRQKLAFSLGIRTEQVRDLFGMVEHGVPYVDCPLGRFHVPVYGRIVARDPETLAPLPYGKTGLLQFITPYLSSYPSISLLTSDLGRVEEKCSCGLKGPVMHVAGRAGVKKLKGCAIAASALL